jgi:ferredoxin
MAFVIAEPCIDVTDQACIRVCPVACIHFDAGKDRKLYIDPADGFTALIVETDPGAILAPGAKGLIGRLPMRQIMGHQAPGTATA